MLSAKSLEFAGIWLFGDKYDYGRVFYPEGNTDDIPVEIVCPKHGPFWRTQIEHIMDGLGCPECGDEADWRERINQTGKTTVAHSSLDEFGNKQEQVIAWRPLVVLCREARPKVAG